MEDSAEVQWVKNSEGNWEQINISEMTEVTDCIDRGDNANIGKHLSGPENIMHGKLGVNKGWPGPRLSTFDNCTARIGYQDSIKSHEYLDDPKVLNEKVDFLIDLMRKSKHCVAYTGAGISTSSGIPDYASRSESSMGAQVAVSTSPMAAPPTHTHYVLTALHRKGLLHHWIQQNHDGLPQKAGYPQEDLNEIHGAWFDPSNPVVKMSGELRSDLYQLLLEWEQIADLCIVMGTSLAGMNADRIASSTSRRGQGTVIINLQQTQMDNLASLRIFAKVDDVAKLLEQKLKLQVNKIPDIPQREKFDLPYDNEGFFNAKTTTTLDLSEGARIKILDGWLMVMFTCSKCHRL